MARKRPSYSDIKKYSRSVEKLSQEARKQFLQAAESIDWSDWTTACDQMREMCRGVCDVYGMGAAELGAEWYEYCREMAIDSGWTAIVDQEASRYGIESDMNTVINKLFDGVITPERTIELMSGVVVNRTHATARNTILNNLSLDRLEAERNGRPTDDYLYSRVTVNDACAFCIMLASRGAVYLSEETASKTKYGDSYHPDCRCVAVPFHKADTIRGYGEKLQASRDMYYEAEKTRRSGNYSEELQERIDKAKREHAEKRARGETHERWSNTNETLIIMRYQQGIS